MRSKLFCVLHVPKCAGRTIESHLRKHLGSPGFWSAPKRARRLPLELFGRKYSHRLPGPPSAIHAISGHFIGQSIEKHFPDRRISRVILLRKPADLVLSWYNFRMMRYIKAGRAPYAFGLHLHSMPHDPVATFLLERWLELPLWTIMTMCAERKAALLDHALAGFDFIGDISRCDELVKLMAGELGIEPKADRANTAEIWGKRVNWKPLRYEGLGAEHIERIHASTQLDEYLWRRWALKEPITFEPDRSRPLLASEWRRPYYEIVRRHHRDRRPYREKDWELDAQKL